MAPSEELVALFHKLRADQRCRWQAGERVSVEQYLTSHPQLKEDEELLLDFIYGEFCLREDVGERPDPGEYRRRFPHLATHLQMQFEVHSAMQSTGGDAAGAPGHGDIDTAGASSSDRRIARQTMIPDSTSQLAGPFQQAHAAAPAPYPNIAGYQILGLLGRGGMGVVYKARQTKLNRLVALKMILGGAHADAEQLGRFGTEAEAVARLQHPNIVQIYEIGEHAGLPFISLEFCKGGSLAKKLGGAPLPPKQAALLVETLARRCMRLTNMASFIVI